jgi:16S rRNA (uracil1498-N3)-methyltransferase
VIRLFVTDELAVGRAIGLSGPHAHYLIDVMRLKAGAQVLAFNGVDGEWRARLARVSKDTWSLFPDAMERPQAGGPDLELLIALIRKPRLETVVEKAAELGARRVGLVRTGRTSPGGANLSRLTAIAAEAAEQTGALAVPEIIAPMALGEVLAAWGGERRLMFCDEAGDAPGVLEALKGSEPAAGWTILIGPEGGFCAAERALIRGAPGVVPVGLGPRILRADTAAIAAMTLWQAALGDWRGA